MSVMVKYATGSGKINWSGMVADAPLVYDNSSGDTSTYYNKTSTSGQTAVSVIYDLGSAQTVTRAVVKYGGKDSYGISLEYSNDGTSWTTANTVSIPSNFGMGTFAWATTVDITVSAPNSARYWRVTAIDTPSEWSSWETRIGDFRIFNGASQYIPSPGGAAAAGVISITGYVAAFSKINYATAQGATTISAYANAGKTGTGARRIFIIS